MLDIVINALVSLAGIAGGAVFMRAKYKKEVEKLSAEIEQLKTQTRTAEIKLLSNASETLLINIIKPLENELNKVRRVVSGLQKAIQKIYDCPYIVDCPVRKQLHNDETGNTNGGA